MLSFVFQALSCIIPARVQAAAESVLHRLFHTRYCLHAFLLTLFSSLFLIAYPDDL